MKQLLSNFAPFVGAVTLACATTTPPGAGRGLERVANRALGVQCEGIWWAVLLAYRDRTIRSEGDVTLEVDRITGVGEQRDHPAVVLMAHLEGDSLRYDPAWLDSLVANRVVDGVCQTSNVADCPDSILTEFLSLSLPQLSGDSTATLLVSEEALNPAACRRGAGAVMGGVMGRRVALTHQVSGWTVSKSTMTVAGTTMCGFTPAEQARAARLEREDSLLRESISVVAGTYRVTVLFGSGDSAVLFARTEQYPMSSIRGRTKDDARRDDYQPITGYYLMTHSAASLDSLTTPSSLGQSFYAVSVSPISVMRDSSMWRGEVDPLVEVHFLDSRAALRAEAESLYRASDQLRDSAWYFMPGTWIIHRDGRVRYDWAIMDGSKFLYRVHAVRISSQTDPGRSR